MSLLATAKTNGIDPHPWLTNTPARLPPPSTAISILFCSRAGSATSCKSQLADASAWPRNLRAVRCLRSIQDRRDFGPQRTLDWPPPAPRLGRKPRPSTVCLKAGTCSRHQPKAAVPAFASHQANPKQLACVSLRISMGFPATQYRARCTLWRARPGAPDWGDGPQKWAGSRGCPETRRSRRCRATIWPTPLCSRE